MRAPAFQFYPADWRKDPGVQALGYFERGVWFEMLCLMHESAERGVLLLNGAPMPESALANILGLDNQILEGCLTKIKAYGVCRVRESDGAIYSKRMVDDERLSKIRRESGKQGGNPALLNQTGNQNPTPSSSPSSSPSNQEPPAPEDDKKPEAKTLLCMAIIAAGFPAPKLNQSDPRLAALVDAGVTPEEAADATREAIALDKCNVGYIVGTINGRRKDAAKPIAPKAPAQPKPSSHAIVKPTPTSLTPEQCEANQARLKSLLGGLSECQ